jgi:hypothetical protein
MEKSTSRIPGTLKHTGEARSEADLLKEMRAYLAAQPGVRFLADVLTALHAPPHPLRFARAFYEACPPRTVLQAFTERPELRVRVVRAITGGPAALLRRIAPAELASQIELLVAEDLPPAERVLRAEEDRQAAVIDLYLKYLDPSDLAAYLPPAVLWDYESHDGWWKRDGSPTTRALMIAELKSIRRNGVLPDSEILDMIGDEALERDLPVAARTRLRAAARKAAREGRPFRDGDLFSSLRSEDGSRDLTDELVDCMSLATLRKVVVRAAELLGLGAEPPAAPEAEPPATKATPGAPPKLRSRPLPEPVSVLGQAGRASRRMTPRPVEVIRPLGPELVGEEARVPMAEDLPTDFDDDVIETDTSMVIEEVARR